MIFHQIGPDGFDCNFTYLIGDEKSKLALVVDPVNGSIRKILNIAREHGLIIKYIANTHKHFDHTEGNKKLQHWTNAEILDLSNKHIFHLGELKFEIIPTPGHTPDGICLLFDKKLITGDTLFVNGIGRTDMAGGDLEALYDSIQKIKKLPGDVIIYPGHDYGPTKSSGIAIQKKNNRYLRCKTKEEFLNIS